MSKPNPSTTNAKKAIYSVVPPADLLMVLHRLFGSREIQALTPIYGNLYHLISDYRVDFARKAPFGWSERACLVDELKRQFAGTAQVRVLSERMIEVPKHLTWILHLTSTTLADDILPCPDAARKLEVIDVSR